MNSAESLEELRDLTEHGLREIASTSESSGEGQKMLVVCRRPASTKAVAYYCFRYYLVGDEWAVSVDHRLTGETTALRWLAEKTVPA